jgi:hypothetical protein
MSSSRRRARKNVLTALAALVVGGSMLVACTPEGPSSGGAVSSSGAQTAPSEASASPSPSNTNTAQVGKDGRTIDPAAKAESCTLLAESDIRDELGAWAAGLQPGQGEVSTDRDGTAVDSCVYALEAGAGTDHSAVIEQRVFDTPQELASSRPFGLLMTAEAVSGLRGDAKYGVNSLTGSTEYVVVSVLDKTSSTLIVSVPSGTAVPDGTSVKEMLVALAKKAGF